MRKFNVVEKSGEGKEKSHAGEAWDALGRNGKLMNLQEGKASCTFKRIVHLYAAFLPVHPKVIYAFNILKQQFKSIEQDSLRPLDGPFRS